MNTLREVFRLDKQDVKTAADSFLSGVEIAYSFSHGSMGWGAYGVIPLLLRYLNNGNYAAFSGYPFRENYDESATLLAFLLLWVDEDEL